jgi:hypothetical protein
MPVSEERRHKHRDDRQHRKSTWNGLFAARVEDGASQRHAVRQMCMDVLDGDRRLVNQNPDRQREAFRAS